MKTKKVIPVLRIFDLKKTKEFYMDWLGFKVEWEHTRGENAPVYMEISLNSIVLHLSEHHGECSPGAKVFIWCTGLKEFHQSITAKKYKYMKPGLEKAEWSKGKDITMGVIDPFGNHLVFAEEL
jgi:extradiol dioxygenase family protein